MELLLSSRAFLWHSSLSHESFHLHTPFWLRSFCYSYVTVGSSQERPLLVFSERSGFQRGQDHLFSLTWLQLGAFQTSRNQSSRVLGWKSKIKESATLSTLGWTYLLNIVKKGSDGGRKKLWLCRGALKHCHSLSCRPLINFSASVINEIRSMGNLAAWTTQSQKPSPWKLCPHLLSYSWLSWPRHSLHFCLTSRCHLPPRHLLRAPLLCMPVGWLLFLLFAFHQQEFES